MENMQTHCPQGHTVLFHDAGIARVESQSMTLAVMHPEIYEENMEKAVQDATVYCKECKQDYPLTDCHK